MQATAFHRGIHVSDADIYDMYDHCPVCGSREPRLAIYNIQNDPKVDMLACPHCAACSASHMPHQALLDRYYAQYYESASAGYTFNEPSRFARHLLRFMRDLKKTGPLRILDFGGGDGSLAVALAGELQACASVLLSITIDVVDYSAPPESATGSATIRGSRELVDVEGHFDIILASAILEHIPDACLAIRTLTSLASKGAYMYARTPFVLPIARLVPGLDITYPAHVHDMGGKFWNRFISTFGLQAQMLSSRPSLVETTLRNSPARTLVAHALKLPAMIEISLLGRDRTPQWEFVGGWEAVLRFN